MQLVICCISTTGSHNCDFKLVKVFSTLNPQTVSDFEFVNSFSTGYFMLVFSPGDLTQQTLMTFSYHKRRAIIYGAHMTGIDTVG